MRKIALISEHASPLATIGGVDAGGQNIYVAHVARQLARRGYSVDVFTRRDNPLLQPIVKWQPKLRVVHVPAGPASHLPKEDLLPDMPAFGEYLHRFFTDEAQPYDVIHANFFMSGLAALPAARAFNLPLVMTFHALGRVRRQHQKDADRFPDARFAIEDELVRSADRIIAECPQDQADLISLYGAAPERVEVVPCGFDHNEFTPLDRKVARARLGWPPDEFAILQLGRLVPRKGIANVIRGLAELKNRHGVTGRLYIVGGNSAEPNEIATPEIARLRGIAEEAGVGGQVVFVGRRGRNDLRQYYCAADVFVTTPWYEPFGITPVEAMACGTPVVGSAVGGIQSTVVDGVSGLLVPPEDPVALGAALARLHADPGLRRRMGEAGRTRANRHYTWSCVARSLEAVYEAVAASRQIPAGRTANLDDIRALASA